MNIAKEVLQKKRVVISRLRDAGFVLEKSSKAYCYSELFMNGDLTALIIVKKDGNVVCSVIDSETGDDYAPLNIEAYTGTYVGKAREEYKALLERVAAKCFVEVEFVSDQANRIAAEIENKFSAPPEHPFKSSEAAVFRNVSSGKWFAIDMCIERGKLDDPNMSDGSNGRPDGTTGNDGAGAVRDSHERPDETAGNDGAGAARDSHERLDVMNVKIDPDTIDELLKVPGICRCYHMNKKYWVTLTMDDRLSDEQVMELMKRSFQLTTGGTSAGRRAEGSARPDDAKRYWLIPSNPANFDVAKGFRDSGDNTLAWHHRINVLPGDIVYIYQTEPVASIMFECEVLDSFLPRPESWAGYAPSSKYRMTLKLIRSFRKGEYPRSWMNEHGVLKTVRGQRSAPQELVKAMEKSHR